MTQFKFSWVEARDVFKIRTMWFVFLQGFAGVFPWNVITYFFSITWPRSGAMTRGACS